MALRQTDLPRDAMFLHTEVHLTNAESFQTLWEEEKEDNCDVLDHGNIFICFVTIKEAGELLYEQYSSYRTFSGRVRANL